MTRWSTAVVAVLALAGCGAEPRLGAGAADELRRGVDEVRVAAGAGDRDGALRALDGLRGRVDWAAEGGRLSDEHAAELRSGISQARRRVRREVVAPQPTPEPVAPTPTAAPLQDQKPKKGKGEHGRGHDDAEEEEEEKEEKGDD